MNGLTDRKKIPDQFNRQFHDYLEKEGLRFTRERREILEGIFAYDDHFTAEDLLVRLVQDGHKTSKATIYRTLPLLVKSGVLTEVIDAQNQAKYEHAHDLKQHAHLICVRCGSITEIATPEIDQMKSELCKSHKFTPVKFRSEILGYCVDCVKPN